MAAKFWVGGGTNTNWNSSPVTNWANSSGGAGNQVAPTVSDDVTFDGVGASSNGASIISATQSVLSLTFTTGYTNTVTANAVLTIAGNFTDQTTHSWAGSSALTISAASTITSNGKTWPNAVTFTGANTKTLVGNWVVTGILTNSNAATVLNRTTAETISIGGLTIAQQLSGTASIILTGGTWTGGGALSNSMSIAGNVTVSASVTYNTGTLTYTSGTVTTTGSTVTVAASTTFNTNGISWNNITTTNNITLTINSLLTITGTLTLSSNNIIFSGTSGFTVATFLSNAISVTTLTFLNTVTYTITTAFNASQSRSGSILLFTSDHATNKAVLTLNNGATCNVLASFTRIDASNGRAIWTFNGVVTTCFNIISLTDLSFVTGKSQVIQGFSNF